MTPGVRPLIAGNWKMNGLGREAAALAVAVAAGGAGLMAELLVCPPMPYLALVGQELARGAAPVSLGAQDCHADTKGAHTGDVAAAMLKDCGAGYVILGHSERRADHGETDAQIKAKAQAAIAAGLTPIICVGETLAERAAGQAEAVVHAQIAGSLPEGFVAAGGVVAYEPVWAIGTGKVPSEADIAAIHGAMRAQVGPATRLLYGGSMKPSNAEAILALPNVDGGLIGGAALVAADFLAIAQAAG